MNTLLSHLEINSLRIKVKLGNSKEERSIAQDIEISLKIFFTNIPPACDNDLIEDTVCYDLICKEISEFCRNREFKLIEYLTYQLFKLIKKKASHDVWLCVKKCQPPIENLLEGANFIITDRER